MTTHAPSRNLFKTPHTKPNPTSLLARTLLLAVIYSQLTTNTATASPLSSLPASAPGFASGAAPAPVPAVHAGIPHSADATVYDTDDLGGAVVAADLKFDDDNDDNVDDEDGGQDYPNYQDIANENDDETMGFDAMGNAVDKGVHRTGSSSSSSNRSVRPCLLHIRGLTSSQYPHPHHLPSHLPRSPPF